MIAADGEEATRRGAARAGPPTPTSTPTTSSSSTRWPPAPARSASSTTTTWPACSRRTPTSPVGLVWAEQDGRGVHVNISGGGVTRYADDVELGQQFLEWLATDGQDTLVADNHEYPANPAVEAEPLIRRDVRHRLRARPAARRRARLAERRRRPRRWTPPTSAERATCDDAAAGASAGRAGWRPPSLVGRARDRPDRHARRRACCGPNTAVWRQQWDTRLPDQIVTTLVLTAGVVACSVALGVGLAWLVGAHHFPGRRVLTWALVLPLAMPSYILGFVTTAVFGVAGPSRRGGATSSGATPGSRRSARCPARSSRSR